MTCPNRKTACPKILYAWVQCIDIGIPIKEFHSLTSNFFVTNSNTITRVNNDSRDVTAIIKNFILFCI